MNYLLDTNAIIYLLKGITKSFPVKENDSIILSFITKIELLSYKATIDEEKKINKFLESYGVVFVDDELISITVDIRKNYGLKLPDSIIVATAIKESATLITSDVQIVKKAPDMNVVIFDPLTGESSG
jgi:predicted nucleic acid-binding protein